MCERGKKHPQHMIWPYLLRNVLIGRRQQARTLGVARYHDRMLLHKLARVAAADICA